MSASCIKKARASVGSLRVALLQPEPEAWVAHLSALSEAIESFSELVKPRPSAPGGSAECKGDDLTQLKALSLDLAACRKLIDHGRATTQVLAAILGGANAGYSSTGSPPPLAAQTTLSVQA